MSAPRTERVTLEGRVQELLPRALYRVSVGKGHEVTAHAAAGTSKNFVRLVVGDRVLVELTGRDVTRARVVKKLA